MELAKKQYKSFKNILTIIESGDIHDKRYQLIIKSLTIQDVESMRHFVQDAEDKGIHLTLRKEAN